MKGAAEISEEGRRRAGFLKFITKFKEKRLPLLDNIRTGAIKAHIYFHHKGAPHTFFHVLLESYLKL